MGHVLRVPLCSGLPPCGSMQHAGIVVIHRACRKVVACCFPTLKCSIMWLSEDLLGELVAAVARLMLATGRHPARA